MIELRNLIPNPKPRQGGAPWRAKPNSEGISIDYADSIRIVSPQAVTDCYAYMQVVLDPGDYIFSARLVSISTVQFASCSNRVLLVASGGNGGGTQIAAAKYSGLNKRYEVPFSLAAHTKVALRLQGLQFDSQQTSVWYRDTMLLTAVDQQALAHAGIEYFDGLGTTPPPTSH